MVLDSEQHGVGFQAPESPEARSPKINRKRLLLGGTAVAVVTMAFLAGRGSGGEQVVAAPAPVAEQPAEAPTVERPVEAPPTSEDEGVADDESAPAVEPNPADITPVSPDGPTITIETNPNPMGLEDKTYDEILALGNPLEILAGSEADTPEDVVQKFAAALTVAMNIDDANSRAEYQGYVFGGGEEAQYPAVDASTIFNSTVLNEFIATRDFPDEARAITMEVGAEVVTKGQEGRKSYYNMPTVDDPEVGTHFILPIKSMRIQYGTRASGDDLSEQSIGADYRVVELNGDDSRNGVEFHLDGVKYYDDNNQEQVAKIWRLGYVGGVTVTQPGVAQEYRTE